MFGSFELTSIRLYTSLRNPLCGIHGVYNLIEVISSWTEQKLRSILKYFMFTSSCTLKCLRSNKEFDLIFNLLMQVINISTVLLIVNSSGLRQRRLFYIKTRGSPELVSFTWLFICNLWSCLFKFWKLSFFCLFRASLSRKP